MKMSIVMAAVFLFGNSLLFSQSEEKKDISTTSACTDLDFLLGDWQISNQAGTISATATVQAGPNHCYLTQTSKTSRFDFLCLTAYSNTSHDWHMLCGSSNGGRPFYSNGVRHGDEVSFMVDDAKDPTVHHRFSFSRLPDGNVRDAQQSSNDNGRTWSKPDAGMIWKQKK